MCYPKPGPRCSSHAAATYAKAHQKVLDAFMKDAKDSELNRLMEIRSKAEREYHLTPAYLKELEHEIEKGNRPWAVAQYNELKAERERRLALVKGKKPVKHRTRKHEGYIPTAFSESGTHLKTVPYSHPNLVASIEDSQNWSSKLTDEEIAAVAHYSQDGYADINWYLNTGGKYNRFHPAEQVSIPRIQKMIKLLDSAFSKHTPTGEPVTLYRRQLIHDDEGNWADKTVEQKQEMFPVGTVYEPKSYLSTSLDSSDLPPEERETVVCFEIRSKTAAPITAISSQGPREYEFLIPRGTKFRVVANNVKVTSPNGKAALNIIQLEEI